MIARSLVFLLFLATALLPWPAAADSARMDTEIDHLLESIAESQCVFIRNGKEHDADDATDHLQMKRERGRRYYDSTEEFIERIASKSSWTGKLYLVRCADGAPMPTGDWLRNRLEEFRDDAGAG